MRVAQDVGNKATGHRHRWLMPQVSGGGIYRFCAEFTCGAKWKHHIRESDMMNPTQPPIYVVEPDEVQPI